MNDIFWAIMKGGKNRKREKRFLPQDALRKKPD
jgi:hypothetical protein